MNTVRRYSDPHNNWWRFSLHLGESGTLLRFANAQAVVDWIEKYSRPHQQFHWDTRDPEAIAREEQAEDDHWEDMKSDAKQERDFQRGFTDA